MPRLHTASFSRMKVKQEHLALLFQSNCLHHLILFWCDLPRSIRLPESPIRHLTLSLRDNCEHVEPLLRQCSTNLEALNLIGSSSQLPGSTTLPLFPKLRELEAFGSTCHLNTLISLAPLLEHLTIYGEKKNPSRLPALPTSLNRLSINRWAINDDDYGTRPFVHLRHLHVIHFYDWEGDRRVSVIPIIQRIFPNLTSLDLDIHQRFRNHALVFARHLPNVTRLKLNIPWPTAYDLDTVPSLSYFPVPEGPLASLHVNVKYAHKLDIETYKRWVIHTVLGPDTRFGGPYLQEVEMVFEIPQRSVVLRTNEKGGFLQSIQTSEEHMFWVYSHGQIYEGPYVGDRDFR